MQAIVVRTYQHSNSKQYGESWVYCLKKILFELSPPWVRLLLELLDYQPLQVLPDMGGEGGRRGGREGGEGEGREGKRRGRKREGREREGREGEGGREEVCIGVGMHILQLTVVPSSPSLPFSPGRPGNPIPPCSPEEPCSPLIPWRPFSPFAPGGP